MRVPVRSYTSSNTISTFSSVRANPSVDGGPAIASTTCLLPLSVLLIEISVLSLFYQPSSFS